MRDSDKETARFKCEIATWTWEQLREECVRLRAEVERLAAEREATARRCVEILSADLGECVCRHCGHLDPNDTIDAIRAEFGLEEPADVRDFHDRHTDEEFEALARLSADVPDPEEPAPTCPCDMDDCPDAAGLFHCRPHKDLGEPRRVRVPKTSRLATPECGTCGGNGWVSLPRYEFDGVNSSGGIETRRCPDCAKEADGE